METGLKKQKNNNTYKYLYKLFCVGVYVLVYVYLFRLNQTKFLYLFVIMLYCPFYFWSHSVTVINLFLNMNEFCGFSKRYDLPLKQSMIYNDSIIVMF